MRRINSRNKGANGEREAAKWLQQSFNLENLPERNLEQVRKGGHDLIGFEPFFIEVKRQETLNLNTWWIQAKSAARNSPVPVIPVVMFRQNRRSWEFLVSANFLDSNLKRGYLRINSKVFVAWGKLILERVAANANL